MRRPILLAVPALLLAGCTTVTSPGSGTAPGPEQSGSVAVTQTPESATDRTVDPDDVDEVTGGPDDDPAEAGAVSAEPDADDASRTDQDGGEGSDGAAATAAPVPVPGQDPAPLAAAGALVPADADVLTVTDWAAIRERLGAEELTSESIQTDRIEFWRGVGSSTVLLTEGALRPENSRLGLRYHVTQDDVQWELRWVGPGMRDEGIRDSGEGVDDGDDGDDGDTAGTDGADPAEDADGEGSGGEGSGGEGPGSGGPLDEEAPDSGLVLRLREDLDLEGLERAILDEVPGVEGAQLLPEEHLLVRHPGQQGGTLTAAPALLAALAQDAETQLAVPGCRSWPDALGVDATVEDQDAVVQGVAVEDLLDPDAWGMAFTGRAAQLTVVYPEGTTPQEARADAQVRLDLAEQWPVTDSVGWQDGFGLPPGLTGDGFEVDASGSQVVATADYRVVSTTAAGTVALAGLVPWAVCAEIDRLAEPTGL